MGVVSSSAWYFMEMFYDATCIFDNINVFLDWAYGKYSELDIFNFLHLRWIIVYTKAL